MHGTGLGQANPGVGGNAIGHGATNTNAPPRSQQSNSIFSASTNQSTTNTNQTGTHPITTQNNNYPATTNIAGSLNATT